MNAEVPLALPPALLPDQNIFRSPEEMRSMRYTYGLLDRLARPPGSFPAYMRDLARRGGGVTGLGQSMLHSARAPFLFRGTRQRRLRGIGAVGTRIDLKNPDVMREVKTLMTLIKPHYAEKGDAWFAELTWTDTDWVAYESIADLMAKSIESSKNEKDQLVAYVDASGATKLGWPPAGGVGFPSAIGIEAMAQYLVQTQAFPDMQSVRSTFVTLDKYSNAGVPLPPDPGVERPVLAGDPGANTASIVGDNKTMLIVGGIALVGLVAFLVMRKKKR